MSPSIKAPEANSDKIYINISVSISIINRFNSDNKHGTYSGSELIMP